jgi:hypothetical protein
MVPLSAHVLGLEPVGFAPHIGTPDRSAADPDAQREAFLGSLLA